MKVLGLAVLIASTSLWAAKPPPLSPALLEMGKTSYNLNCASCHGDKGVGNGNAGKYLAPKPTDFVKGPFKHGDKVEDLFLTITNGVKSNPAMRSFKGDLSDEQRWAIAYYVQSFRKVSAKKK
jgi:mono/diheme cytochrome c family protein